MDITLLKPTFRQNIYIPSSKSELHRLIICAFLSDKPTDIFFSGSLSDDIKATLNCIKALGADYETEDGKITVYPKKTEAVFPVLDCRSSGTTLRFFLCICAGLGIKAKLVFSDGLSERPLSELCEALRGNGCKLTEDKNSVTITCGTTSENFVIKGDISSQFISGLMFLCSIKGGKITLTTPLQSKPYADMTEKILSEFGCNIKSTKTGYEIKKAFPLNSSGLYKADGDFSNAAFALIGGITGKNPVTVKGINRKSKQGDSEIINILSSAGAEFTFGENSITAYPSRLKGISFSGKDTPDIIMPLCIAFLTADGKTEISDTERLKLKETDRIKSLMEIINSLGGKCEYNDGTLTVFPSHLSGGKVNGYNDHRTVMTAVLASTLCEKQVTVTSSEAVEKSYPEFFGSLIF